MDYFNREIMYDRQHLNGFRKSLGAPLIDRTGTMNRQIRIIDRIPSDLSDAKGFERTTDHRARSILKKCSELRRDLRVSYSGGIDSTVAMAAIIKNIEEFQDVKVVVVLTQKSIKENPRFYVDHIKGDFETWKTSPKMLSETLVRYTGNPFFVTSGELGDQLFGSALMFNGDPEKLSRPWYEVFNSREVDFFLPLMQANPQITEDDSTANALWWMNFTLKYQWVQLRMFAMMAGNIPLPDFFPFFGGDKYQKYSLATPMSEKFSDFNDPKTYKMPAKEYIYSLDGNKEYRDNKVKVPSLKENLDQRIADYVERVDENLNLIKMENKIEVSKVT